MNITVKICNTLKSYIKTLTRKMLNSLQNTINEQRFLKSLKP